MRKIALEVFQQQKMLVKTVAPGLSDEPLCLIVPETIAEKAEVLADKEIAPRWQEEAGGLTYRWRTEGKVEFQATVTPEEDFVDVALTIKNIGQTQYENVFVFTCLNPKHGPGNAPSFREPLVKGPFIRVGGRWRSIYELPPHGGPRPELHFVMSQEAGLEALPTSYESFKNHLSVTADVGFIATEGARGYTIAMACKHPLFLFHNKVYWCIHACPNIPTLAPNETKETLQRVYIARESVQELYERARREGVAD